MLYRLMDYPNKYVKIFKFIIKILLTKYIIAFLDIIGNTVPKSEPP